MWYKFTITMGGTIRCIYRTLPTPVYWRISLLRGLSIFTRAVYLLRRSAYIRGLTLLRNTAFKG